jgi:hypothetical protein
MNNAQYNTLKSELYNIRSLYENYLICTFGWSNFAKIMREVKNIFEYGENQ